MLIKAHLLKISGLQLITLMYDVVRSPSDVFHDCSSICVVFYLCKRILCFCDLLKLICQAVGP